MALKIFPCGVNNKEKWNQFENLVSIKSRAHEKRGQNKSPNLLFSKSINPETQSAEEVKNHFSAGITGSGFNPVPTGNRQNKQRKKSGLRVGELADGRVKENQSDKGLNCEKELKVKE